MFFSNCCEPGNFASYCDQPMKNGAEKGWTSGNGKTGKELNAFLDVFKAVGGAHAI